MFSRVTPMNADVKMTRFYNNHHGKLFALATAWFFFNLGTTWYFISEINDPNNVTANDKEAYIEAGTIACLVGGLAMSLGLAIWFMLITFLSMEATFRVKMPTRIATQSENYVRDTDDEFKAKPADGEGGLTTVNV